MAQPEMSPSEIMAHFAGIQKPILEEWFDAVFFQAVNFQRHKAHCTFGGGFATLVSEGTFEDEVPGHVCFQMLEEFERASMMMVQTLKDHMSQTETHTLHLQWLLEHVLPIIQSRARLF